MPANQQLAEAAAIDTMTQVLHRNAANSDQQRLQVIAGLVNVFNFAVQVQGDRINWNEYDAQAFGVAMAAIDSVGQKARDMQRTEDLTAEVEQTMASQRNYGLPRDDGNRPETHAEADIATNGSGGTRLPANEL